MFYESTESTQANAQASSTFDIVLTDPCTSDTITATSSISNMQYQIGRDGQQLLQPTYNQFDSLCPASYGLSIISNGSEVALNGDQLSTLTLNSVNGELTIDTSDFSLHGQTWTVKLYF